MIHIFLFISTYFYSNSRRVVFGWNLDVIRRKLQFNSMTTKNKYNIEKCSEPYILEQLKAIKIIEQDAEYTYLISLSSLDLFIKVLMNSRAPSPFLYFLLSFITPLSIIITHI